MVVSLIVWTRQHKNKQNGGQLLKLTHKCLFVCLFGIKYNKYDGVQMMTGELIVCELYIMD